MKEEEEEERMTGREREINFKIESDIVRVSVLQNSYSDRKS